jgi:hypothetical protein
VRSLNRHRGRGCNRLEGDLGRLAGFGALVEQVEPGFPIVGRDPFVDSLPREQEWAQSSLLMQSWRG